MQAMKTQIKKHFLCKKHSIKAFTLKCPLTRRNLAIFNEELNL